MSRLSGSRMCRNAIQKIVNASVETGSPLRSTGSLKRAIWMTNDCAMKISTPHHARRRSGGSRRMTLRLLINPNKIFPASVAPHRMKSARQITLIVSVMKSSSIGPRLELEDCVLVVQVVHHVCAHRVVVLSDADDQLGHVDGCGQILGRVVA